jgi:imidazolonepropionase-like amidohydrolase
MKQKGVFLVPTLITYDRLKKDGVAGGMPQELVDKVGDLVQRGQWTLKNATEKGVDVCYGSDLLGDMHKWQAHGIDLHLKAGVSNVELLKSLVQTPYNMIYRGAILTADTPPHGGVYGYTGWRVDLLVVNGDVLENPRLLMDPDNIKVIIANGKIVKNELGFKKQESAAKRARR